MQSAVGMCFNWKILVILGGLAAGVLLLAPGAAVTVLPLLLLAICPLSMVVMMFAMRGMGSHASESCQSMEWLGSPEAKRERLAVLQPEERRLERELGSRTVGNDEQASGPLASQSPSAGSS